MQIKDVQEMRSTMEVKIFQAISEFEQKTNLKVEYVNLYRTQRLGYSDEELVCVSTEIRL